MPPTTSDIELHVTDQRGRSTKVRVPPGIYLIGRSQNCQIRLPARERGISRRHARIVADSGDPFIEDLESHAGTMVNGKIVRRHTLESGDVISIGGFHMKVRLQEEEPDATPDRDEIFSAAPDPSSATAEALVKDLAAVRTATDRLMQTLGMRVVGQRDILRFVWATILAKGHCLLVGVPGLAKTLMVSTFGEALGLQAQRIQFTPDLLPSDIVGSNVIHESDEGKRYFEFVQGPVFTQLLLADEINRTPPKTQAALLEAMQERQVTVADKSYRLPEPFFVIATQNPIEQEGTYPLPEAQQDRFMLCVSLDYPGREDEIDILIRTCQDSTDEIPEILSYQDILQFQEVVNRVVVTRESAIYAADLARASRPSDPSSPSWVRNVVEWGAGPRAGQALLRTAKALAAMDGRPAIGIDDIREVIAPVFRHRIVCNFRARAEGLDELKVISRIAEEVKTR